MPNHQSSKPILLTGGTGTVGSALTAELVKRGASVRVLVRDPESAAKLPKQVEAVHGDLLDPAAVQKALEGVHSIYLLNAVAPDELTQGAIVLDLAKRQGVQQIVYHSVFEAERFKDVPHFLSKWALEGALRELGIPFTILRPNYFFQNEASLRKQLTEAGVYGMPLGTKGVSAVDVRDIADAAASVLTADDGSHDGQTYNLVGPEALTGQSAAQIWTEALGNQVRYGGHEMDQYETFMRSMMPAWSAFDMRMMFQGYVERGFAASEGDVAIVTKLLGHQPRRYRDFVQEIARAWAQAAGK